MRDLESLIPGKVFSPALWLKIIGGSLLAGVLAAAILYIQLKPRDGRGTDMADDESSFVAPRGILDSAAKFAPVDQYTDTPGPKPEELPDQAAPLRMLDPTWKPVFNGI